MRRSLLLSLFLALSPLQADDPRVLDASFHHLRNAEPREWSDFPESADTDRLLVTFDLETPDRFRLLTLRQEETKQPWAIQLNGEKLGNLPRDHHHLEHGIAVPAGLLKKTGNVLEISTTSENPDDIRLGDLALHDALQVLVDEERAELLFQQRGYRRSLPPMTTRISLRATDSGSGEGLPCRFTIIDAATGALVFIGAESDDRLAVREGVVYSLDGHATFRLAGDADRPRHYEIYCGRGFEYSLDRKELVVDGSQSDLALSFTLTREVSDRKSVV